MALGSRSRALALVVKVSAAIFGIVIILYSVSYFVQVVGYLFGSGGNILAGVMLLVGSFGTILTGAVLVAMLPESLRTPFRKFPSIPRSRQVYGFGSLLAVGVGATLGSPLFILIPENIMQYELISVLSLVLAAVLSALMAKVYGEMYSEAVGRGEDAVGGPSFTKIACGPRSVRYFITRLSMWLSNTALAAYTEIVFLIFDLELMPKILVDFGLRGLQADLIIYPIAGAFVAWTVINVFFEKRALSTIGILQIVLTIAMGSILVYQSYLLGSAGSWDIGGLLRYSNGTGNFIFALITNTGYLYLLFFGFQEIQALERDTVDASPIPVISFLRRGYVMNKVGYFKAAMIMSVLVAAAINIFYATAVYSVHPNVNALEASQIPALYLSKELLGPGLEILMGAAFLIATITTFVPAFLAASRHLTSLAEDGFMPRSLGKLSWLFTLAAILILALGNQDFLVEITDYLVLVSLGLIAFSPIWMSRLPITTRLRRHPLALVTGIGSLLAGGAIYFVNPSVVIFGTFVIVFAYLLFDIRELGSVGSQLFLAVFDLMFLTLFSLLVLPSRLSFIVLPVVGLPIGDARLFATYALALSSLLLVMNILVDVKVLGRTALSKRDGRQLG